MYKVVVILVINLLAIPSVLGSSPPSSVGQCSNTFIKEVTSRYSAKVGEFGAEESILTFTNGIGLYLYQKLRLQSYPGWGISEESGAISLSQASQMFQANDKVKICLEYIPIDCPARNQLGDRRGEIYYISNYRNNATGFGHLGRNPCGGA